MTALLTDFFGPYKSIGKVRELSVTFEAAKKELFQHVFTDFRQHVQHRNEASEAALSDACLALDAFGDGQTARHELMAWFTKLQVEGYRTAFAPGPSRPEAALDQACDPSRFML